MKLLSIAGPQCRQIFVNQLSHVYENVPSKVAQMQQGVLFIERSLFPIALNTM